MAKKPLGEYEAKRQFTATPEPPAKMARGSGGPLLFVVQMHSATRLHFDFRLECDGVLLSWAVPKGPSLNRQDKRLAVQTEDHPFDYASFEGVIPAGQYGAGEVIVWDCGVYSPDEDGIHFHDREEAQRQVREGIARGKLSVLLRGEKLKGSFALVRTAKDPKSWLLIKHRDRFASQEDVTERDRSVLCGHTVQELKFIKAVQRPASEIVPTGTPGPLPGKLMPMLAEIGETVFDKPDWSWEPKLDGYRVLAFLRDDGVKLQSRNGFDLTPAFPALTAELADQHAPGTILDGELLAFDPSGRPSFNALQNRMQLKTAHEIKAADRDVPIMFYAFDLPFFCGLDLRQQTYADRRRFLSQCLLPSTHVKLVHAERDGRALQRAALASGFEGVMGKRDDSRYEAGRRSGAWLKVKPTQTAEFVIGGFTEGKGARKKLGAIVAGYWEDQELRFASQVGSGFTDESLDNTLARLEPLRTRECPFTPEPPQPSPTTWVEPRLVAEVKFHSWTEDGHLRAPVFLRLRDDLDPASIRRNEPDTAGGMSPVVAQVLAQLAGARDQLQLAVGAHRIKLTHLNRVYWPADDENPELTKRDLLRYLAQVSHVMLPHLADRPLTMIRMPEGITGERFFQKHWEQERPEFVESVTVWSEHKSGEHNYIVCNNLPTLLWLAQSGTLEYHVWHSRTTLTRDAIFDGTDFSSSRKALDESVLNLPDYVVFDIDPYIYSGKEAKGAEPELNTRAFEKGKEVAFHLRELLNSMSLEPVVKTSGKTGLHVFVPIQRAIDFEAAKHVCELVGKHLLARYPKDITMDWSVPKRTGKIFIDHNMNVRGKTLNVAYSPRGEPGAPVSMPLSWDELAGAHPRDFTIVNAGARMREQPDRWRNVLERKQDLQAALK